MNIHSFIESYKDFLYGFAEVVASTLELIGILIILIGTVRALIRILPSHRNPKSFNVLIGLGRSLALALECKMGAEIIHTVVVRDLKELATLAVVILIRALLAVIIHWEIRMERQAENDEAKSSDKSKGSNS